MADKQEIKYKVRKIDGTYGAEGTISLNAIQDGGRYLVHRALVAQSNKKRQGTASTKTRSEIRGGGKKPWKQKGTGNARSGSSNSPLWRGGGVTFGPKPRSNEKKLNIKEKRLALSTALYYSLNKVTVVDNVFNSITVPKTKNIATLLNKFIPESQDKKSLVITHESNRNLTLSIRNLPNVQLLYSNTLSIRDLLSAKHVIITEEALKHLTETI